MAIILRDADTGNEIITFKRRGKWYSFLRDATTKRFIKKLNYVEVRVFHVIDYGKDKAKKDNPLYADFMSCTLVAPNEVRKLDKIEDKLSELNERKCNELFGMAVTEKLLEISGIEYGSELTTHTTYRDGKAEWEAIWKHHKGDRPRTQGGEEVL